MLVYIVCGMMPHKFVITDFLLLFNVNCFSFVFSVGANIFSTYICVCVCVCVSCIYTPLKSVYFTFCNSN
jgi:hypothetical protein